MTPSTGDTIKALHCPMCRRKNLVHRWGTVTAIVKKETKQSPADFAVCGFCNLTSTVEKNSFTQELTLAETFSPGTLTVMWICKAYAV
jgi:transcription elongation factor Elf1